MSPLLFPNNITSPRNENMIVLFATQNVISMFSQCLFDVKELERKSGWLDDEKCKKKYQKVDIKEFNAGR